MKQQFLRHSEGCDNLLLFFSGWGAEPCMFSDGIGISETAEDAANATRAAGTFPMRTSENTDTAAYDVLMLWDYRDMDFDARILSGYKEVRVLAWSMGVWAAGQVLSRPGLTDTANGFRLAVNGTPFPIHDGMGIPAAVFDGTLASLSDRTLGKFRRRMCGSTQALEQLLSCGLTRSTDELREELSAIRETVLHSPITDKADLHPASISDPGHSGLTGLSARFSGLQDLPAGDTGHFSWSHAIAGTGDMIFPAANQIAAWETLGVPITIKDIPHYDSSLFRQLLYKEGAWTRI